MASDGCNWTFVILLCQICEGSDALFDDVAISAPTAADKLEISLMSGHALVSRCSFESIAPPSLRNAQISLAVTAMCERNHHLMQFQDGEQRRKTESIQTRE
jgi:hypothetical protein